MPKCNFDLVSRDSALLNRMMEIAFAVNAGKNFVWYIDEAPDKYHHGRLILLSKYYRNPDAETKTTSYPFDAWELSRFIQHWLLTANSPELSLQEGIPNGWHLMSGPYGLEGEEVDALFIKPAFIPLPKQQTL